MLPTKPQPIANILENGYKQFIRCFPKVLPLVLAEALVSVLLHLQIPLNTQDLNILINVVVNNWVYLFLYMVISIVLYTAIFYRIGAIITQSDMGNWEALRQGLKKWLPVLLATWLYTFLVIIGFFLIIPGVIFLVSLGLFMPLILFENATGFEALLRSHQLVWKHWLHVALVLMIPFLIIIFSSVMASAIVEGILGTTFAQNDLNMLVQITYITVDKLLNPLFYVIIILVYYDLKQGSKPFSNSEKHFVA